MDPKKAQLFSTSKQFCSNPGDQLQTVWFSENQSKNVHCGVFRTLELFFTQISSTGSLYHQRYTPQKPNLIELSPVHVRPKKKKKKKKIYCKVTNFRPVPIFVLLSWNWFGFVRTNFRTFEGLKRKLHWNSRASKRKKFSYGIKFSTFSKVRK